jgi:hypothetical protein
MKINKSLYLAGFALCTISMASCELEVDQPSAMEGKVIYSSPDLANAAVMSLHQSFAETNSYRGRFIPYFGTNNDCEIFNNYGGVSDPYTDKEASLACYNAQPDNTYMNTSNNAWAKLYEGIERANKALFDINEAYGGNITNAEKEIQHLYGELLTLRGMIYYDLVKAWGDVPYRFEPVNGENIYKARESRVVILKKVIEDLKEAENYIFDAGNGYAASTERVSKVFVRGLMARTALFLAGKSYYTGEGVRYNIEDAAERQSLYQLAYDKCVAAIDEHPKKLDELKFKDNFTNLCKDVTTAGLESIYEIPFSAGRGRVLYTWGGKHSSISRFTALAKGGVCGPNPTLWFDYSKDDIRRNITVVPFVWAEDPDGEKDPKYPDWNFIKRTTSNLSGGGWSFGKLRWEWMNRRVTSSNDDGINWQVMRLADIYMMAAEAANELDDLTNAKKYIKPILDRAYTLNGTTLATDKLNAASDKDKMFKLIVEERKLEFAGEALRKVDLMRWGILSSKMDESKKKMIALANREDFIDGDGKTIEYSNYPEKVYYEVGMKKAPVVAYDESYLQAVDENDYEIYGLESGDTDAIGKGMYSGTGTSSYLFCLSTTNATDKAKVQKYIDTFYLNDPDTKMFWPIWQVFVNSSNGMLNNDGY